MNINQRKRGGGGIIESSSLNYTSQPQPLREQRNAVASVSRGVGIDGCRHPSPSGVNTLPTFWQAWIAIGCALVLWLFTYSFIVLVESWKRSYWMMLWRATWPWLGGLYVLSGYAHFTMRDDFCNIMPPVGLGEFGSYREVQSFGFISLESLKLWREVDCSSVVCITRDPL